jgi:hypothetical protein
MKTIKEIKLTDVLQNVAGDKVRATLIKLPGVGNIVGAGALILNYGELNDGLEKYKQLKLDFEDGTIDTKGLLDKFIEVEEDLKTDFVDMLQSAGEMAIPGFSIFSMLGIPLLTSLSIESILDEISDVLPFEDDVEESMIPYLAAIKDIGRIKKQLGYTEDEIQNPENFMDDILSEGKKKNTTLCARGKSAAKAKFDVWPSAYSSGYAVQVCKGKIKGLDGKKKCSGKYCSGKK